MGPGGGLRVVLDGHRLLVLPHHACAGAVVQVDVGHLNACWQGGWVNCEVVVLGAHFDATSRRPDGVVAAMVAELELEGRAAKGLPQDLVPHADAKHRLLSQNLLGVLHSIGCSRGVARAIREEHAVGVHLQHLRGGPVCRHHCDAAAKGGQAAQDVLLDAIIICHHVERFPALGSLCGGRELPLGIGALAPLIRLLAGHLSQEVLPHNAPALGHANQLLICF
mmetsp:Transcript_22878/g.63221  ORF Transcript_22878/g.63221 Transcript_22878/m.63221 type:complete len:223 (+) Transcript_22878:973-1641(+)